MADTKDSKMEQAKKVIESSGSDPIADDHAIDELQRIYHGE